MPKQPIPKRLRFEVFKRDSFKCQYCGRCAPEVVLHADHIKPEADGGETDLLNLITSCVDCNLGKGAVPLSDESVIEKRRTQLEELQERREQLEMLMQWQEGLRDSDEDVIDRVCLFWESLTPGYRLNIGCITFIKKLIAKYSVGEVMSGMRAASTYLRYDDSGRITQESANESLNKLAGVCSVERAKSTDPDLARLLYIRGIVRNRCPHYFNFGDCLLYLKDAVAYGISIDDLEAGAKDVRNVSYSHGAGIVLAGSFTSTVQELCENKFGPADSLSLDFFNQIPSNGAPVRANGHYQPSAELWEWFQGEYPGEVNPFLDAQLLVSAMESAEEEAMLRENLPKHIASDKWRDSKYIPKAENYLSKRLYRIAPKERVVKDDYDREG